MHMYTWALGTYVSLYACVHMCIHVCVGMSAAELTPGDLNN